MWSATALEGNSKPSTICCFNHTKQQHKQTEHATILWDIFFFVFLSALCEQWAVGVWEPQFDKNAALPPIMNFWGGWVSITREVLLFTACLHPTSHKLKAPTPFQWRSIPDYFSCAVYEQRRCLSPDPERRPDIVAVGSRIADLMMRHMDALYASHYALEKRAERDRKRAQRYFLEGRRSGKSCCRSFPTQVVWALWSKTVFWGGEIYTIVRLDC